MQSQLLKQPPTLTFSIVVFSLGSLLGIASVLIPHAFLIVGILGIVYIVVAILWPETALIFILLITSTIFDINTFPSIPIGFGHVVISDILLFVLFGIIFIKGLVKSSNYYVHTPLDFPLFCFFCTALVSTVFGIYSSNITFNQSLGEVRVINYFLTFYIVTNLIRNENQLHRLIKGIVFLAVFVALSMIAQYVLGSSYVILPGRVEVLDTAGTTSYGITRVLPPGQSLVLVVFVYLVVQIIFNKNTSQFMFKLIQLGIVGFAVVLTFNRSFWVAVFIALLLVSLLISLKDKIKLGSIVLGTILIGTIIFTQFSTSNDYNNAVERFISSMGVRFATLFNPNTTQESSLLYRNIENEYAYIEIESHPLIGSGLGASYRPVDSRIMATDTSYIHNGHLWLILKTGLIGYLFFMWYLLLSIKHGIQNWNLVPDMSFKGFVLSSAAIVVGILFALMVNPVINQSYWNPIIGIMLGVSAVILKMNTDQSEYLEMKNN